MLSFVHLCIWATKSHSTEVVFQALNQLQKDFNTLQAMVSEKEEELTVLTQDVEEQELLKHEIDQLHQSLTEKEKQQIAQQHSLSVLKKEIASLQAQAKSSSAEISLLKETLDSKSSQLESWQGAAQEHKLRADQLKQSLELMSAEQESESKSSIALRQSLEKEVARLQSEVSEQANHLQRDLERRQQEINRLETERDGLKKALESTSKKLQERESQAQKNRRSMEQKALNEQRTNQEKLIQQMLNEHAGKATEAEKQIKVLVAKLQESKEKYEMEKNLHKEAMRNLLEGHQQELLAAAKDKATTETSQQVTALREEVQRLKQLLLSERHQSVQLLQSRESTPDSDGTNMSSSCNSTGAEEGLQLLPHNIQKLCNRLLKEGKEVLTLTESHPNKIPVAASPRKDVLVKDVSVQNVPCLSELETIATQHDFGNGDTCSTESKGIQCNLSSLSETISESLLIAKDKLIEQAAWLSRLTISDAVSKKQDLVELVKSLFTLEKQWLLKQIDGVLIYIASFTEQVPSSGLKLPANSDQLLTRTWWNNRTELLMEKHTALVNQLISAIESSASSLPSQQKLKQSQNSPEMLLLMEQLESCKWQIKKQKELLEYSQVHEENQRREFQNHLEQEKINSSQLSSQLREWRKRCSQAETNFSTKQNEVSKLAQALDQARRDLDHCRSDLDLEKFHGQQLVHALDSERRNFHQMHTALYSERQRIHTTHRKNMQTIQECINCSWRENQNALLQKKIQLLGDTTDSIVHEHPQLEILRLRRHRDSLCFQKRYLLRLLCNYQASEAASLSVLDRMGVCTPPPLEPRDTLSTAKKRKCTTFRIAAIAVLTTVRFNGMARVLKELRIRQGSQYESDGRSQRWRHWLTNSQTSLVPSQLASGNIHQTATSTGSSRNGVRSPSWYPQSSSAFKSGQNSVYSSQHFNENNSDSFSIKALRSEKSESEQRINNDRRFEDCVERLEYLHQRMGLDTS